MVFIQCCCYLVPAGCVGILYMINWRHYLSLISTLRPRQNGCHFADDTFMRIFLKENVTILIRISLKFVPKSPIDSIPALFQIMAWRRPGDKPFSEAMMVNLLMHICVTRPQWVNRVRLGNSLYWYMLIAQLLWTNLTWLLHFVLN